MIQYSVKSIVRNSWLRSRLQVCLLLLCVIGLTACNSSSDSSPSGTQFDRMGIAGVNTVFIPSAQKNDFNAGDPSLDELDFSDEVIGTTQSLRSVLAAIAGFPAEDLDISPEAVRNIVLPDRVTLDLSAPDGFPNGRLLTDDVIDTALQVTLNRSVVGDGIDSDSIFLESFPYLGEPNSGN